ncbi:MAG: M48 family metallopeptidase, partial [bacterium]|nr:M48 family metallopeptidase [bacterium]
LITLIGSLISLPLTLLGFYVSRLFGLATLSIGLWTKDFLMSLGLAIVFTLIIYLPLYWLMEKFQRTWWLWISLLAIPFTILMQVLVPFVITPLFNTQRPLDDSALSESITTMTREAGVPIENLFIINDSRRSISANAMVTGFGASKRIVFSDNLLSHYTADEIVFITAHELGHYVKHHVIYRMILNIVSICVMFFLLYRILHWFVRKYGTQLGVLEVHDISLFPLLGLIMSLLGLLIAPGPLALSRSVERQADTYALSITHNPEGGIGAFKKLSFQSFGDPSPSAIRQFWFGGHPTIKERIETLKGEK